MFLVFIALSGFIILSTLYSLSTTFKKPKLPYFAKDVIWLIIFYSPFISGVKNLSTKKPFNNSRGFTIAEESKRDLISFLTWLIEHLEN